MRVGHAIRTARIAAGLTQRELAKTLGRNIGTIGEWERGVTAPSLTELGPLCRALGVDCERFVEPPSRPEMTGRRRRRS